MTKKIYFQISTISKNKKLSIRDVLNSSMSKTNVDTFIYVRHSQPNGKLQDPDFFMDSKLRPKHTEVDKFIG